MASLALLDLMLLDTLMIAKGAQIPSQILMTVDLELPGQSKQLQCRMMVTAVDTSNRCFCCPCCAIDCANKSSSNRL